MRFHRRSKLHRLLVQIRFLKKNFEGINFCGLDKSKHFAGTNFRDFVRKPQKLVPAKISTIYILSNRHNGAQLMILLKEGLSLIINRLSSNSNENFLFFLINTLKLFI